MHPLLQLALGHLPVGDEEAQLRGHGLKLGGGLLDRLDTVVQVEGLPAARVLTLERDANQLLVVLADGRANRATTLRGAFR